MNNKIVEMVPTKTDYETAKEIKEEVIKLYEPLLKLLADANRKGFQVQVGCGLGPLGNYVIQQLQIVKVFKDE